MDTPENWDFAHFLSINSSENRFRVYTIRIIQPSVLEGQFTVILLWGRMNQGLKKMENRFSSEFDMLKFVESVLRKRKKNGYQLFKKTDGFPTTLSEVPPHTIPFQPIQLGLF